MGGNDYLVFATYNVTPQHWEDFINAADFTEEQLGSKTFATKQKPTPLYVLVHSRTQQDFSITSHLTEEVKTEFADATYAEMYDFGCEKYWNRRPKTFYFVLDKKSEEDRKVIIINRGSRCLYVDEENNSIEDEEGADDELWMRHRVPFEKAAFLWSVMSAKPGMEGDEFVENMTSGSAEGL